MPILTLKHATVLAADGSIDPADTMENFYEPDATTPDTLEVIDGWLDTHNRPNAPTDKVQHEALQSGSLVRYGQVGSNVAFDLFDDLFPRQDFTPDDVIEPVGNFVALPGAQIRFYLPFAPTGVLFTWMVNWTTDLLYRDGLDYTAGCSPAYFVVDRAAISQPNTQRRVAVATVTQLSAATYDPGASANDDKHWPRVSQADQKWSGHKYVTGLTAGWHTAGIFIGMSDMRGDGPDSGDIAQQARVRSRSIRYIAFK